MLTQNTRAQSSLNVMFSDKGSIYFGITIILLMVLISLTIVAFKLKAPIKRNFYNKTSSTLTFPKKYQIGPFQKGIGYTATNLNFKNGQFPLKREYWRSSY